jgi:predicted MarR family transcription regulator
MDKKQDIKGCGLGSNSYRITTVMGRNQKYNQIREQILLSSQRRGMNTAMNKTIQEINQYRHYNKK